MTKLLTRRRIALLALAAGIPSVQAQAATPATERMFEAKASAILGGAPSRLAMMRAQQRGEVVAAAVRPASLSTPVVRRAVLQVPASANRTAWSGRPDVFGSVALKVGHTSLDARWKRAANAPLSTAALSVSRAMRSLSPIEKIEAINRYVNDRVTFTDDSRQYGRPDRWTAAAETLRRGRGDCEDYALTKLQMLRAAGIPASDLYLVLVKDLVRRADHAVLIVRADGRSLLLDNGTDRVADADTVGDYRPIFTFASSGTYTHGYRRSFAPPVEIASNDAKVPAKSVQLAMVEPQPIRPASDTSVKPIDGTDLALLQRSRSASLRAFMTGFSR